MGCERCKKIKNDYKPSVANVFIVCAQEASFFGNKRNKTKKKETKSEILKKASALRNGNGGQVVIHVNGRSTKDRQLQFFDECVSQSLNGLITDGTPYTDVFSRQWLSNIELFQDFTDVIILSVVQSFSSFATVQFNTKLRHDHENIDPKIDNILYVLEQPQQTHDPLPAKTSEFSSDENNRHLFNEDRNLEIKAFHPPKDNIEGLELVEFICHNLKLLDSITSFSKIPGGGYLYIGISEDKDLDLIQNPFKEKIPKLTGFLYEEDKESDTFIVTEKETDLFSIKGNLERLRTELKEKVGDQVCVLNKERQFVQAPSDLIEVRHHEIKGHEQKRYLLEIYIKYVDGIVFSDSHGPLTYISEEVNGQSKCIRMPQKDWLKKLNDHFQVEGKRFEKFSGCMINHSRISGKLKLLTIVHRTLSIELTTHFVRMSSSFGESSDSESSQFSYRSVGSDDDMSLLNRSCTSSDSDTPHADYAYEFTQEDRAKIVDSGRNLSADCGIVFPEELHSSLPFVKLKLIPWSISVVSGSMKHLLRLKNVRSKPTSVEWDVCVFSDRNPLMILTFSSSNDRKTTLYNSSLAREIILRLNSDMKSYLTCTHGVLVNNDLSSDEIFRTRISNFREQHKVFAVPISLQMSAERCSSMLTLFMEMQRSASRPSSLSSNEQEDLRRAQIFPVKAWTYLKILFPKVCQNVEEVVGKTHRFLIVQLPKYHFLEFEEEDKKIKDIPGLLFDIFAIDYNNPVMVLTFAVKTTRAVDDHKYNIASHILKTIDKDIHFFSVIKGVIEKLEAQNQTDFESTVRKIQERDLLFGEEYKFAMDECKCQRVLKTFCQLMPDFSSNEFRKLVEQKNSFQQSIRNDSGSADPEDLPFQRSIRNDSGSAEPEYPTFQQSIRNDPGPIDSEVDSWSSLDQLPNPIRLVIIGKEGVGKTSTCNTILGEEIFTYEDQSEIQRVEISKVKPYNRKMIISDTKGCGHNITPIVNGVTNVHAVVVVLRGDAIDEKDHQIHTNLVTEFGEDVLYYTLVVITKGGKIKDDYETVKSSKPDSVDLVNKFRNGAVNFDNRASKKEKREMVKNFMLKLSHLVQANNESNRKRMFCPCVLN